jgi:hypothetical protein
MRIWSIRFELISCVGALLSIQTEAFVALQSGSRMSPSVQIVPRHVAKGSSTTTRLFERSDVDCIIGTNGTSFLRPDSQAEHRRKKERTTRNLANLHVVTSVVCFVALLWPTFTKTALAASTLSFPAEPTGSPGSWRMFAVPGLLVAHTFGGVLWKLSAMIVQLSAGWYVHQLSTNPMLVKSVSTSVIGFIGDYMAQWFEYRLWRQQNKKSIDTIDTHTLLSIHGRYDLRRGISLAVGGLLFSGPLMHVGYEMFERVLPIGGSTGASSSLAAILHVVADSLFLDCIFVATTFIITGLMEGYSFQQLFSQFKSEYVPSVKAGLATSTMLMPIEFVAFRFLPLHFRVLAVNCIDVVWDAVISFMAHRNRKDHDVAWQLQKQSSPLVVPVALAKEEVHHQPCSVALFVDEIHSPPSLVASHY